MKIIHSSGKEIKLSPGTVLNMERTNPFFNSYGEQSIPIKLPADPHNKQILGFPDDIAGVNKMPQRADATIQSGVFSIRCRQAILSANSKEIDTSYYLNIGSFYEKMKDVKLSTVFKDKIMPFPSVKAAIQFVRGLMINPDPRFSCFRILVEHQDTGEIAVLNQMTGPFKDDGYFQLYNEIDRTETINEKIVAVPAGYYITPFVKVMHVLEEIFKYLGYKLEDNFFAKTEPFRSMVFLNNNIDTIVGSEIRYDQIVPDCTISTVLDIFRNKFCCEFIPDEAKRTVKIVLFNDIADSKPTYDLSKKLVSPLNINHGAKFKQLRLSAEKGPLLSWSNENKLVSATPDYLSKTLPEIASKYPEAVIDRVTGAIYREGFSIFTIIRETVGCLNCDYYAGGTLDVEKKESPDILVNIEFQSISGGEAPFVGKSRSLNSTIRWSESSSQENTGNTTQAESELKPMLCFTVHNPERRADFGTIYGYSGMREHLWDYTLCFSGPNGLYEKFWKKYDDMLRNSMRPVTVKLFLSDIDKLNLSAYEKVSINNQECLPNIIKYNVGKQAETECTFLTTKLYHPISSAISESEHFPSSKYRWHIRWSQNLDDSYIFIQAKENPATFFLPPPTEEEYNRGGQYHKRIYGGWFSKDRNGSNKVEGILIVWLEPVIREY